MREGGLTLVELLVGIAVLSIIVLALSQYLLSLPRVNVRTRDVQAVTLAAKTYFEEAELRLNADFDAPTLPTTPTVGGQACAAGMTVTLYDTSVTPAAPAVRRVTLNCSVSGTAYTFAQDFGRRS